MVRNARDADADDFMPDRRDVVAAGKRTAKQKNPHNRGSHERLTELYNDFNDDQKAAADTMGMHTLMNLLCTNLNNNLCDWLLRTYEPESKEFVIPHRGRIPLDEDAVYCTLGVPNGGMDVPYKVDREIQDRLFPEMFPGLTSMPLHSVVANMLSQMNSSGDDFRRLLLMYLISTVFGPTTSTHLSSRCFPVLADIKYVANMNWCKFIAGFLHTALSKRIYNKGCRLHLMLTYVDNVDLSTVNMSLVGGLPAPHKFAATAWTDAAIKAVLAADTKRDGSFGKLQLPAKHSVDFSFFGGPHNFSKLMDVHTSDACSLEARTNVEALVGQFASGMSNLLGNLVQGWTAMTMGDGAEVANQFRNFIPGGTSRPIGSRGRYKYNDSQVLPGSEDEFMNDLQNSDVDDYVRGNDGHAGDVQMDNVQSDPQNQQSRVVDDVAASAKVSAPPLSSAPGPSKDGVEVSKRVRDSEDEVRVSFAKRPKFDPVAARRSEVTAGGRMSKQANADPPARSSARPKKGPHTGAVSGCEPAHTATRSSPRFASSNTGDPVVLEDMRDAGRRQKNKLKKTAGVTKTKKKVPLERMPSEPPPDDNVDCGKASATGASATSLAAPVTVLSSIASVLCTDRGASAGGSDELISPRTANVAPALVYMRHGFEGWANQSSDADASRVQTDNHSNLVATNRTDKMTDQHQPTSEAGTSVHDANVGQNKAPAVAQKADQTASHACTAPASVVPKADRNVAPQKTANPVVCTRKSPRKRSIEAGIVHDHNAKVDGGRYVSASMLFPPTTQSKTVESLQMKGNVPTSPRLKHTPVPLDTGVPYTPRTKHPGKGAGKNVVIDIPDTTPRPPARPKVVGPVENEMFVDLSPLSAAVYVIEKDNVSKERLALAFTPPSFGLGIDLSQPIRPLDAVPISYAYPTEPVPMMVQPNVHGKKVVNFAEPIVQVSNDDISPSLHEAYCKMEEDVVMKHKIQKEAPSSSGAADACPFDDVHSSVTPGSVH